MSYDEMAAATNGGGYDARVTIRPDDPDCASSDREYGYAALDYGNRVTVRWDSGASTRENLDRLVLA